MSEATALEVWVDDKTKSVEGHIYTCTLTFEGKVFWGPATCHENTFQLRNAIRAEDPRFDMAFLKKEKTLEGHTRFISVKSHGRVVLDKLSTHPNMDVLATVIRTLIGLEGPYTPPSSNISSQPKFDRWSKFDRKSYFVREIEVHHGVRPSNALIDINHGIDDINHGFLGRSVWLVPEWTDDWYISATSFCLTVTEEHRHDKDDHQFDLAFEGGKHWYIDPVIDKKENLKICKIALYRKFRREGEFTNEELRSLKSRGYHRACDINCDRGGDYLYLIWGSSFYGCSKPGGWWCGYGRD